MEEIAPRPQLVNTHTIEIERFLPAGQIDAYIRSGTSYGDCVAGHDIAPELIREGLGEKTSRRNLELPLHSFRLELKGCCALQ